MRSMRKLKRFPYLIIYEILYKQKQMDIIQIVH